MIRQTEFLQQLQALLRGPVQGFSEEEKFSTVRALCKELEEVSRGTHRLPRLRGVPFVTGRRPFDEVLHAGFGSSEHVGLITDGEEEDNQMFFLYHLDDLDVEEEGHWRLACNLGFLEADGTVHEVPGWVHRPLTPEVFVLDDAQKVHLAQHSLGEVEEQTLVFSLRPNEMLLPAGQGGAEQSWAWEELAASLRKQSSDAQDPFTFGQLFHQEMRLELLLSKDDHLLSQETFAFGIYDARRFCSLYQRILDDIVTPDTRAQCKRAGVEAIDASFHPWFPVLSIGSDKADLYMRALSLDIVEKQRYLTDPRWLLEVGLYLELLTCLGIFEAVKDELGDLLTPEERRTFEENPKYAPVRERLNPGLWREVWEMRKISFAKKGVKNAGPVSFLNLLNKKKVTLAFLEAHHEDLKYAIELAGPNIHNAQETWHRVFRDAERAVLRKCFEAFPELESLGDRTRDFVLWHQKGKLKRFGMKFIPGSIMQLFGDQDGLYASACSQYRASMNEVAHWAQERQLMDYTGTECVPLQVSILQAHMNKENALVGALQRRDGYQPSIQVESVLPEEYHASEERIEEALAQVALFTSMDDKERKLLASKVREIHLGPMERIIIQGREGSSLFILMDGQLEVLTRHEGGQDLQVAILEKGAVIGEFSFLTGEKRGCTVRALRSATVLEVRKSHMEALIEDNPQLLEDFTTMMEERSRETEQHIEDFGKQQGRLRGRIRKFWKRKG